MKKLLRKALVCLPTVIALYTAADFLYCTFIKRIKYVFCVKKLIKPVFWCVHVIGFILGARGRIRCDDLYFYWFGEGAERSERTDKMR